VFRISTDSPASHKQTETATPPTVGWNNTRLIQLSPFDFVSVL